MAGNKNDCEGLAVQFRTYFMKLILKNPRKQFRDIDCALPTSPGVITEEQHPSESQEAHQKTYCGTSQFPGTPTQDVNIRDRIN